MTEPGRVGLARASVLPRGLRGWRWWQLMSFGAGCAAVAAAVTSPLDSLGQSDVLTAHVAQHIILGDLAAPLLVLGLPTGARHGLRERLGRMSGDARRRARLLTWVLSPVGALLLWALAAYAWYVPALHRAAVPGGPVHVLDHISFVGFGLLLALAMFDPREPRSLRRGVRDGGLPWWARHVYSMCSRVAMLPPAMVVWFAAGYHVAGQRPGRSTPEVDQANAASLMIAFEMILFAVAFILAFVFLAIADGRARAAAAE